MVIRIQNLGLVEIPAILISVFILLKMGRRMPLCITMVAGGIACLLTTILPPSTYYGYNTFIFFRIRAHFTVLRYPLFADTNEWVSLSLVMAGKFSVSSSNVIMPLYTAELFPTVIRNLGVGTSNIPAGIALIMVPYLWDLVSPDGVSSKFENKEFRRKPRQRHRFGQDFLTRGRVWRKTIFS